MTTHLDDVSSCLSSINYKVMSHCAIDKDCCQDTVKTGTGDCVNANKGGSNCRQSGSCPGGLYSMAGQTLRIDTHHSCSSKDFFLSTAKAAASIPFNVICQDMMTPYYVWRSRTVGRHWPAEVLQQSIQLLNTDTGQDAMDWDCGTYKKRFNYVNPVRQGIPKIPLLV